jgi:pimeloyl-ACP methyl ester carboxylesterase
VRRALLLGVSAVLTAGALTVPASASQARQAPRSAPLLTPGTDPGSDPSALPGVLQSATGTIGPDWTDAQDAPGVALAAARAAAAGVHWKACPVAAELPDPIKCGRVTVPIDYAHPDGPTIRLMLSRLRAGTPVITSGPHKKASGKAKGKHGRRHGHPKHARHGRDAARAAAYPAEASHGVAGPAAAHHRAKTRSQGALVFNPGGPGGSGLYFPNLGMPDMSAPTRHIWATAHRDYDMVGFDPRGVGYSAPLSCVTPAAYEHSPTPDPRHPSQAEKDRQRAKADRIAAGCVHRSGPLLAHMTTEDMARDLDVIRAALGRPRLNYFGVSYGTYLGAVYAALFPSHVRRMVTDSVVDPDPHGIWYGANLDQDVAFNGRWSDWRHWAAAHHKVYGLGRTAAAVQASFEKAMRRLAKHPAGKKGRLVGPGELQTAATQAAYYDQEWVPFAYQLSRFLHGDPGPLVTAAEPAKKKSRDAREAENGQAVYLAVQCGDAHWPRDWQTWDHDNTGLARRYPFETWANAWLNLPCADWRTPARDPLDVRVQPGAGLPPVLILQSERDAATPYHGALELHGRLPGSRLVTEVGRGSHGLISFWNRCLVHQVSRYLAHGTVAARDVRCAGHPLPKPSGKHGGTDANAGRYY